MNNIDIIESVKIGMQKSAKMVKLMNFTSGGKITTEYVATISIGLSLAESKNFIYDDEKIIFEYSTRHFISATIPLIKRLESYTPFSKSIIRKTAETKRPGRIDLAILERKSGIDISKCAIEVKGDKPAKRLLLSDIRRQFEYFKHSGPTGNSNLGLALNCSFESYNKQLGRNYCITLKDEKRRVEATRRKYQRYIKEFSDEIPEEVSARIEIFTATKFLLETGASQEEYDWNEDD